jgi:hypothetical protein
MQLTDDELRQMRSLKAHCPFRIVYGAKHPETGEFVCAASHTKRPANDYVRKGWLVFILEKEAK